MTHMVAREAHCFGQLQSFVLNITCLTKMANELLHQHLLILLLCLSPLTPLSSSFILSHHLHSLLFVFFSLPFLPWTSSTTTNNSSSNSPCLSVPGSDAMNGLFVCFFLLYKSNILSCCFSLFLCWVLPLLALVVC